MGGSTLSKFSVGYSWMSFPEPGMKVTGKLFSKSSLDQVAWRTQGIASLLSSGVTVPEVLLSSACVYYL